MASKLTMEFCSNNNNNNERATRAPIISVNFFSFFSHWSVCGRRIQVSHILAGFFRYKTEKDEHKNYMVLDGAKRNIAIIRIAKRNDHLYRTVIHLLEFHALVGTYWKQFDALTLLHIGRSSSSLDGMLCCWYVFVCVCFNCCFECLYSNRFLSNWTAHNIVINWHILEKKMIA